MRTLLALIILTMALPAFARTYEGVTLPDTIQLGGQTLVLNGMGLREKFFVDVYVGGLYLPVKTTDGRKAANDDVPKRLAMVFKRNVDRGKLAETMRDSIGKSGNATVKAEASKMAGWMEDVSEGQQIVLDYVPGKGTTVTVKGKVKGTIAGAAFMKAVWGIYVGRNPADKDLRDGLLGK